MEYCATKDIPKIYAEYIVHRLFYFSGKGYTWGMATDGIYGIDAAKDIFSQAVDEAIRDPQMFSDDLSNVVRVVCVQWRSPDVGVAINLTDKWLAEFEAENGTPSEYLAACRD